MNKVLFSTNSAIIVFVCNNNNNNNNNNNCCVKCILWIDKILFYLIDNNL